MFGVEGIRISIDGGCSESNNETKSIYGKLECGDAKQ